MFQREFIITLNLLFSVRWVHSSCRGISSTIFKQNRVVDGVKFKVLLQASYKLCLQECLLFNACGAVNIYPTDLRCELILMSSPEAQNTEMVSTTGITLNTTDIPKDYAGACRDHTCPVTDVCVALLSGQHVCIEYDFCHGLPLSIDKTTHTIDYSRGLPNAFYSCIPGAGYVGGVKTSACDPLTKTWSLTTIVCSTDLPEGCGDPPPLPNTNTFTRPYQGDPYTAVYTCQSFNEPAFTTYCPMTKCTGIEQWTPGASVSCNQYDCHTATVYNGRVSCTVSGRTCQRWDSQTPHSHGYYTGSEVQNYCRLTADTTIPWCYTVDAAVRWEYCPVPSC